jgi:two-component system, OmpR family, response regulator
VNPVVLVLDDDPGILDEVCETLSDEGIEALRAESGAELWAHAETHSIDLFILDLVLPGESGLSIAKTIRERSDVGIIIVTRKSTETDRVVGLEIGADDYITKPFSPRELVARVRSVLRRTQGNAYPGSGKGAGGDHRVAEFSGWEFDLSARQLLNPEGTEVPLTTAEFELLRVFVESPNRVHSRDYLLDSVHGREWAGYDRGIDGLVSRLRKKIRPEPGTPDFIKTARGAGYLFAPKVRLSKGSDET